MSDWDTGTLLGHCWGTAVALLGHCWGTAGALGHWGTGTLGLITYTDSVALRSML